jgi:hypothetical protein
MKPIFKICVYDQQNLIARHVRSYERRMDFELPDHVRPLLAERLSPMRALPIASNTPCLYTVR